MSEQFNPGDVVMLKSGGPKMKIARIEQDQAICKRFNGPMQESGSFDLVMLQKPGTGIA